MTIAVYWDFKHQTKQNQIDAFLMAGLPNAYNCTMEILMHFANTFKNELSTWFSVDSCTKYEAL